MARRHSVFYSFSYRPDALRVMQIRKIGALDGNEPVSVNDWEQVKKGGDPAVERWIDGAMKYRQCVIVMIGADTAHRPWVRYEIAKAWNEKRGLFGIRIHNIRCPNADTSTMGPNPFDFVKFDDGTALSSVVTTYNPSHNVLYSAYNTIAANIEGWISTAIAEANRRK